MESVEKEIKRMRMAQQIAEAAEWVAENRWRMLADLDEVTDLAITIEVASGGENRVRVSTSGTYSIDG